MHLALRVGHQLDGVNDFLCERKGLSLYAVIKLDGDLVEVPDVDKILAEV
ncbi:hypothetical protein QVZ43_09995 [Marinobacter sp. chi1]|uniref:Uncharacterized protein n=1 Tax=Marinobacter suaedae TaxID=3057675 RepID=A0ABT8W1E7_9GAMM|nr:hypothetical protein [Marinobacter sp. chi1]MDO3722054.1 hypothetical protein [Marinobacter sp. chi1]